MVYVLNVNKKPLMPCTEAKARKLLKNNFDEINKVCLKHNLSISHEDGHGSFEIEKYDENNIKWLEGASKNY